LKKKQIYFSPPGTQAIIVNLEENVFISEIRSFGVIIYPQSKTFYECVDELKHAELKTMKSKTF